jgi:hypothetical protein
LEKLFPQCEIFTYEFKEKRHEIARRRCHSRIHTCLGRLDPAVMTPTTAVLIDGPKWLAAIELAKQIVDSVALVAIHDMEKYIPLLKSTFRYVAHSGHPSADIKALDKYLDPATVKRHNQGRYYGTVLACVRNA